MTSETNRPRDASAAASASNLARAVLRAAETTPGADALITAERCLSFSDLASASKDMAARLLEYGVTPGDRVAVYSENSIEYVVVALGTWLAGATLATIYPSFGPRELTYVNDNCRPRLTLVQEGRDLPPSLTVEQVTIGLDGTIDLPPAPAVTFPETSPETPALICYTSGSTAVPKPVTHSHQGLLAMISAYAQVWHMNPQDRTLVCLPMAWMYGLSTATLVTLLGGGAAVILPRYNPARVIEAFERQPISVFPAVTTIFAKMVDYIDQSATTLEGGRLRLSVSGGEPRNERAFARWHQLTGCPVHDTYCASELSPVVTYDPTIDPLPRPGSAGRVVPGACVRVVDETGADVADGQVGEGIWQGPGMMLGYWNEPALTEKAFTEDGWYRSGDLVRIDRSGYLYVVGRVSDTIIRGGSNISPAEVEAVLNSHPSVTEAAVVGIPHEIYGEEVVAVIVPAASHIDPVKLASFCRTRLASYKVPSQHFEVQALPRNENGKLVRREIERLLDGHASAPL